MRSVALALCCAAIAINVDTARAQPASVQAVDYFGRQVRLDRPAARVVPLFYGDAEVLCAIGAGKTIVGLGFLNREAGSHFIDELCPRVKTLGEIGRGATLNLERLISLEPDLVIVENDRMIVDRLEGLGLSAFASFPRHFQDVLDEVTRFGALTGRDQPAAKVRSVLEEIVRTVTTRLSTTGANDRPSVYYARNDMLTTVSDDIHAEIIEKAGGRLVSSGVRALSMTVSVEQVLAWNPEVIIIRDRAPITVDSVLADPRFASVAAVRRRRVFKEHAGWIEFRLESVFGLLEKAAWLHPAAFADVSAGDRASDAMAAIKDAARD